MKIIDEKVSFEKLVEIYDSINKGILHEVSPPTEKSISFINNHFQITLPENLIELAKRSQKFGYWFAGLGEDYSNPFHIIRINRRFKRLRRKRHGDKWRSVKPRNFVVINHGHDDDCDCLDISVKNIEDGDYEIVYWYPGIDKIEIRYSGFHSYLESYLRNYI